MPCTINERLHGEELALSIIERYLKAKPPSYTDEELEKTYEELKKRLSLRKDRYFEESNG